MEAQKMVDFGIATEVEETAKPKTQPAPVPRPAPEPLIPRTFEGFWKLATVLHSSQWQPKGYTAEQCFIAMIHGDEIGLPPLASVQNIAVINGRPSVWGDAMLALCRASGQLELFEEWFEGEFPADNYTAVCRVQRKGEKAYEERYSIEDAKRAGLWETRAEIKTRDGRTISNPAPWWTNPKRMLKMRARSFRLRDAFADILKGILTTEEARDFQISPMLDDIITETQARSAAPVENTDDLWDTVCAGIPDDIREQVEPFANAEGIAFIEAAARGQNCSIAEVLRAAAEPGRTADFWRTFLTWHAKNKPAPASGADDAEGFTPPPAEAPDVPSEKAPPRKAVKAQLQEIDELKAELGIDVQMPDDATYDQAEAVIKDLLKEKQKRAQNPPEKFTDRDEMGLFEEPAPWKPSARLVNRIRSVDSHAKMEGVISAIRRHMAGLGLEAHAEIEPKIDTALKLDNPGFLGWLDKVLTD